MVDKSDIVDSKHLAENVHVEDSTENKSWTPEEVSSRSWLMSYWNIG